MIVVQLYIVYSYICVNKKLKYTKKKKPVASPREIIITFLRNITIIKIIIVVIITIYL